MSRDKIRVELDADVTGFRTALNRATIQVQSFGRQLKESLTTIGGRHFAGITGGFAAVGGAAALAATGGVYLFARAMGTAIDKSADFETAAFNMKTSIEAANRQFEVGSAGRWEQGIARLGERLRIYSETELRQAAADTVDMTKRLGLSADQMEKVIEIAGDLGAGKFGLTDSTERVTAALRGEAEAAEKLGLTLNEDYVKGWYAANNATGTAWKDLTDLEKAQVRYQVLLEQAGPSLGKAGASFDTYSGSLADTKNEFGDLQKEAGNLVTQNTFVIDSLHILSDLFKGWKENIIANREALVGLVKSGIMALLTGIEGSIEAIRFFYNGWQGLKLIAHGAVVLIIKGLELIVSGLRTVLKPMDLFLEALAKIGIIDSNPLADLEKTLEGFGDFSAEEFTKMLDEVEDTNDKFDEAKQIVTDFKNRIADIPAEYKDAAAEIQDDTGDIETEVVKVGDQWVTVFKDAEKASNEATRQMIENNRKVAASAASAAPAARREGGPVGYARGGNPFFGSLPGFGGGDRRLILVEDGEHVIRKEATARLGHSFFQKFNSLNWLSSLPKYASGGPIAAPAADGSGEVITFRVELAGSRFGPFTGSRADASGMLRTLQQAWEGSS